MLDTKQALMRAKRIAQDPRNHEIHVANDELPPLEWQQVAKLAYDGISMRQHRETGKSLKYITQVQWNHFCRSEAGRNLAEAYYGSQGNQLIPEGQTLYVYERGKTTPFAKLTHNDGSFIDRLWYGYFLEIPRTDILDYDAYQRVARQTYVMQGCDPKDGLVYIAPFACEFHTAK